MFKKRHPEIGARPGTLVIAPDSPPTTIRVIYYSQEEVHEEAITDPAPLKRALDDQQTTWIDVQGFGDESLIRQIAEIFSIHPLAIEDIVNIPHRPAAEVFDEQLLLIARMVSLDGPQQIEMEQVSILVGKHYVITFQERPGDVLDPIRKRIRSGKNPIRRHGAGFLAYAILDTIVDGYYPVVESIGDYLESLEDAVVSDPSPRLLQKLNRMKNQLVNLRRVIWPQREAIHRLVHDDSQVFDEHLRVYLRDTFDHCVQTSEVIEMYREMVTGLINTYLSSIANRTNDVMKVLTIMASIFIPLTFMAGIYGMNFEDMPELKFKWSYPLLWLVMFSTAVGMLIYFRRLGWIGRFPRHTSTKTKTSASGFARSDPQLSCRPISGWERLDDASQCPAVTVWAGKYLRLWGFPWFC